MGFSLTCMASRSVVTCLLFLFFPTCKKLNGDLKGQYHGWLVHIVLMPLTHPYSLWDLKNLFVNGKINHVKKIRLLSISNQKNKQQKWTLKTCKANQLSKTTIAIRFNLFQVCPSVLLLTFWLIILKFHSIWLRFPLFQFW